MKKTRRFRARFDEASHVTAFVESFLEGIPPPVSMRLLLVVEELFVNTVTHGHGGDSEAPVDVSVDVGDDHITVVYEDTAPPFDPFANIESPDRAASLETRSVGRLGVFLITQFAERWSYARAGDRNCVTVQIRR